MKKNNSLEEKPVVKELNLKEYLKESGMMQKTFAERAGVTPMTIHNILIGNDYSFSIAGKLVKAGVEITMINQNKGKLSLQALLKAIKGKAKSSTQDLQDKKT